MKTRKADSDIFNKHFNELVSFYSKFNRYPDYSENLKLYNWIAGLRGRYKSNELPLLQIEKLDSIGFVWDWKNHLWHQKGNLIIDQLIKFKDFTVISSHTRLFQWLKLQLILSLEGKLPEDKQTVVDRILKLSKLIILNSPLAIYKDITTLISSAREIMVYNKELKILTHESNWLQKLNELKEFRNQCPGRWPQARDAAPKEVKLGIWCQDQRAQFRDKSISEFRKYMLLTIGFNFEGKLDLWKERFHELKKYLITNSHFPDSKSMLYLWAIRQAKKFDKLNKEQKELLKTIDIFSIARAKTKLISWDSKLSELRDFLLKNKAGPRKQTDEGLYIWLQRQRQDYRNGKLLDRQKQALIDLGIDLTPRKTISARWDVHYELLKKFRELNPDRWPGYRRNEEEKKLYLWCQTQRQVFAGKMKARLPLSQEKVDKLNQIGFRWLYEK